MVQLVAPVDVNCCVFPSVTETDAGEIVCAAIPATSEIVAVAVPFGPVAVTDAVEDEGIVAGAV